MRVLVLLASPLAALALSSCGGSTPVVTDTQPPRSGSATAGSTGASSPSQTTSATLTTTTSSATAGIYPRCVAADLRLSLLGQQGAAGHGVLGFSVSNASGRTCHTFGYPGVLFLNRTGHPLPTAVTRTTHDFFGYAPVVGLDLAPGSSASFRLGVTHGIGLRAGCRTAAGVQVIPPDDTVTMRVTIPGGAYECGSAAVSPLRPGSSAFR